MAWPGVQGGRGGLGAARPQGLWRSGGIRLCSNVLPLALPCRGVRVAMAAVATGNGAPAGGQGGNLRSKSLNISYTNLNLLK